MSGAGHDRAKSKISGPETNSPNTTAFMLTFLAPLAGIRLSSMDG